MKMSDSPLKRRPLKAENHMENDLGDKRGGNPKSLSLWGQIIEWDIVYTNSLALCSDSSAYFGSLRPLMTFLEISCHGIPWIFGAVFHSLILAAHQKGHQQIFVNLLAGKKLSCLHLPLK